MYAASCQRRASDFMHDCLKLVAFSMNGIVKLLNQGSKHKLAIQGHRVLPLPHAC